MAVSSSGVRAAESINRASSSAKTQPAARRAAVTETGEGLSEEELEELGGMGAESLSEAEGRSRGRLSEPGSVRAQRDAGNCTTSHDAAAANREPLAERLAALG